MTRILLSLVLSILFSLHLIADETVIQGKIKGFDSKTIKVGVYQDYITNEKEWLTETVIQNGSFKLTFDLAAIEQIILKIEDKETSLFA